jgi:hypothetical protein
MRERKKEWMRHEKVKRVFQDPKQNIVVKLLFSIYACTLASMNNEWRLGHPVPKSMARQHVPLSLYSKWRTWSGFCSDT